MVVTYGAMVKNMKVPGLIIKCKAVEPYNGQMVKHIKEILWKIRDMAMVDLNGKMVESMTGAGPKENSMAQEFTGMQKVLKNKATG
jgi:hypothetical protein